MALIEARHIEMKMPVPRMGVLDPAHNYPSAEFWYDFHLALQESTGKKQVGRRLTARIVTYSWKHGPSGGRYPPEVIPCDRKSWLMEVSSKEEMIEAFLRMDRQAKEAKRKIHAAYVGVLRGDL